MDGVQGGLGDDRSSAPLAAQVRVARSRATSGLSDPRSLPDDFGDLLESFVHAGVEFLIVGSYALARHGYVRATLRPAQL